MGIIRGKKPSIDSWIAEIKQNPESAGAGMYLIHNGVVRNSPRAEVREKVSGLPRVSAVEITVNYQNAEAALAEALSMPGIIRVNVWLNEGIIKVGDDIMLVLVCGDIRPRVIAALEKLVGNLKTWCISEKEIFIDN